MYKTLVKGAKKHVNKLTTRSLMDAFGQTVDKKAPQVELSGGLSVYALMPKKNTHLRQDAAVWKYFTNAGSPGLTGSGATLGEGDAASGRAARRGTNKEKEVQAAALDTTLKAYGECTTKGNQQDILLERAKKVSAGIRVNVCNDRVDG